MIGIFNESTVSVFKSIKNVFRQIATWTLIAGVVFGAILIMFGNNTDSGAIIGKIMATFFILGLAMLICTNNIYRLENERPAVQIFALISLATNFLWFILWTICIWADISKADQTVGTIASLAISASIIAGFTLVSSNIFAIYEGNKKGTILPLKLASTFALGIVSLHGIVVAFNAINNTEYFVDYQNSVSARFDVLSGFLSFCFFVMLIIMLISSSGESSKIKAEKRKEELREKKLRQQQQQQAYYEQQRVYYEQQQEAYRKQQEAAEKQKEDAKKKEKAPKTDDELRAEIEEKVRREMIEKEVREKLEKEAKAKAKK